MMVGLGCIVGPVLGSFLMTIAGYDGAFYALGGANITLAAILFFVFPKKKVED